MHSERIEALRQEYTGQYVVVDSERADLVRFKGLTGQVKTVNANGRVLVEFECRDKQGRYDLELDYVKVVDKPEPKPAQSQGKVQPAAKTPAKKTPAPADKQGPQLSHLELARMEKATREASRRPPGEE